VLICKSISLRLPSDVIYRALKDKRLEQLFPEFFTGVTKKITYDEKNSKLEFTTTTNNGHFQIKEIFKLKY
jgi:hypothetical protein